ncbi:MAG: cupin domain-containing protein [Actinomycetes bacterium]
MADFRPFESAKAYEAPFHNDVDTRRLQGLDVSDTDAMWVGLSVYAPGGSIDLAPARSESIYVVLDGELVVTVGDEEFVLRKHDSLHLNQGEVRSAVNRTDSPTTMLVSIATLKDA